MFVGGVTRRGGRKHCEDLIATQSNEGKQIFLAVFDGHGGIEAAKHAQENLWESIKRSEGFGSDDPHDMVDAIRDGFKKTQEDMWKVSRKSPFLLYKPLVLSVGPSAGPPRGGGGATGAFCPGPHSA